MQKTSGRASRALSLAAVVIATAVLPLRAVETKFWTQDELSDFEKGNLSRLSLRSDGRLLLAPALTEVFDSSTPYLWAVAQDSKGNIYTGGGGPTGSSAKLVQIDRAGKATTVAEVPGLEIHAIAVDSRDRVYAATVPDGKVYRIVNGKPEIFYDPHAKYIWAMAFSKKGDLYLATGDHGDIHKVAPDGKGAVFFKTEETHARSLAIDAQDNLIVGTEPGGVILRVSPAGDGFVLYQTPKREITALAVGKDGSIYAAAVGAKPASAPLLTPPPIQLPAAPAPAAAGAGPAPVVIQPRQSALALPPTLASGTSVSGGSEVYRIGPDGAPRRVWSHSQDVAYALLIDDQGRPLVGTGNKGNVYRIDSDLVNTLLLNLAPTQVTGLAHGANGQTLAVTGNIGKVYRFGPGLEKSGTYESEPLDASAFTYWGRLAWVGDGAVTFDARSGNVVHPQQNWSPWAPVPLTGDGGRIAAPPARFLQYRATLTAAAAGASPEVRVIEIAYMSKNIAPTLQEIEITPPNYKFSAPATSLTSSSQTITLPALGSKKRTSTVSLESTSSQSMQYAKGFTGVRWLVQDDNQDTMEYRIELRGVGETGWKLLKDNVREKYYSWDSAAFPDGKYVVRVTASDKPSNPPGSALSSEIVSDPFLIDNTPPQISGVGATATGSNLEVRWHAKDALSVITRAEYSVNGGEWVVAEPVTRLSDSPELDYRITVPRPQPGEYTVAVRVSDEFENQSVEKTVVK